MSDINPEITTPDATNQVKDEKIVTGVTPIEEKAEDPNWKAFRDARKKDRIALEEAQKRAAEKEAEATALKAAMEVVVAKQNVTQAAYQQYYGMNNEPVEEDNDKLIEKKVNDLLAKREAEAEKKRQQQEQAEYPNRLVKDFPDFNHVISQENMDYLDYHYPEISRPLSRLPDGYAKWHDVYHAIKKFIPNNLGAQKSAARADANAIKPKSISSTGITQPQPPAGSHILSEDRKAANWARMQANLKGVG
jgi:hypothetical protein